MDQLSGALQGVLQSLPSVVLAFIVPDECLLIVPFGLIGQPLVVELVRPYQFPFFSVNAFLRHEKHAHREQERFHSVSLCSQRQKARTATGESEHRS